MTRRGIIAAGTALPLVGILSRRGYAAEFSLKYAVGPDPDHPLNVRGQEAMDRIRAATHGRLDIKPVLGSGVEFLLLVRYGAVDFCNLSTSLLGSLVPTCAIPNVGFAFHDYGEVWASMDGKLGDHIRAQIPRSGFIAVARMQDNGFRQIITSAHPIITPDDLTGFRLCVPPEPVFTSLFAAFGAVPKPIDLSRLYSALQSKIVEGQESALDVIALNRLYEVQTSCSMTNHVWDGYWTLGNRRSWANLPADLQKIVTQELDRSALEQRGDMRKLGIWVQQDLLAKGLQFDDVDWNSFRTALRETNYYKAWRARFGDEAWSLLEETAGTLTQ